MNCFISSHSDDAICDLELPEKHEFSFCDPTGMPIPKILSIEIMLSRSIYNGLLRDKQMNLFRFSTVTMRKGIDRSLSLQIHCRANGTPSAKVAEERRVAVQVGSHRITYLDAESIANFILILQRLNDIPDLERLFCVQAATFDFEFFEHILLQ